MPDCTDLDRRWSVNAAEMAASVDRQQGGIGRPGSEVISEALRYAGAIEAHPDEGHVTVAQLAAALARQRIVEPSRSVIAARRILDALDGDDPANAAVLEESIKAGTPLQVDEDEPAHEGPGFRCGAAECGQCYPDADEDDRDPELRAIGNLVAWLQPLSHDGRRRVLAYVCHRFDVEIAPY